MSEPFLAEIRIFGFNFPPRGWALCDGQILPINQNQSLFSLLGTTYGGDGRTTFALPDLRGRVPTHISDGHALGQKAGAEAPALTVAEMPSHAHGLNGTGATATTTDASGALLARAAGGRRALTPYDEAVNLTPLAASAIANAGNGQGHNNMQPYTVLSFAIAIQGLFPSRN
jgi:microcystin-dependent protein